MSARRARADAWTALTPQRPRRPAEIALILVRNAIPWVGIGWFGGSIAQFLLLSVFGFGLTIANIGLAGVSVMNLRGTGGAAPGRIGVATLLNLLAVTAFIAVLLTALGGWPIFVIAGVDTAVLRQPALWWSALAMQVSAAPGLVAEIRANAQSPYSIGQLKARDQPRVGAAMLGVAASLVLSGWAARLGTFGGTFLMLAFTAFSLLRELRPDWLHRAIRPRDLSAR